MSRESLGLTINYLQARAVHCACVAGGYGSIELLRLYIIPVFDYIVYNCGPIPDFVYLQEVVLKASLVSVIFIFETVDLLFEFFNLLFECLDLVRVWCGGCE